MTWVFKIPFYKCNWKINFPGLNWTPRISEIWASKLDGREWLDSCPRTTWREPAVRFEYDAGYSAGFSLDNCCKRWIITPSRNCSPFVVYPISLLRHIGKCYAYVMQVCILFALPKASIVMLYCDLRGSLNEQLFPFQLQLSEVSYTDNSLH